MNHLRILVVEDHEFQRRSLEQSLRSLGVQSVLCASDGAAALRMLRQRTPIDIIITDLMMPEVDGIELLAVLQKEFPWIPLVMASANEAVLDAAVTIARGHGLDVLGAVVKPITPGKLRTLLGERLPPRRGPPEPV